MPYMHIFVDEIVALLGAMTDKCVWKRFRALNKEKSNDLVKFAGKYLKENFITCELQVKRVVTIVVVPYQYRWPINFILHFAEL